MMMSQMSQTSQARQGERLHISQARQMSQMSQTRQGGSPQMSQARCMSQMSQMSQPFAFRTPGELFRSHSRDPIYGARNGGDGRDAEWRSLWSPSASTLSNSLPDTFSKAPHLAAEAPLPPSFMKRRWSGRAPRNVVARGGDEEWRGPCGTRSGRPCGEVRGPRKCVRERALSKGGLP